MSRKLCLLLLCLAAGIAGYVTLDHWAARNGTKLQRLERMWSEDVALLESSGKLPAPWFKLRNLEVYGGTEEAKAWLKRIQPPLKTRPDGTHKMEVLLLSWEEDGKTGAVVQYNMVDIKTQNMVWELGRTFILSEARQ